MLWTVVLLGIGIDPLPAQTVVINELMAANTRTVLDHDGDSEDWLELYNAGSTAVSLAGWVLSDDEEGDPDSGWTLPALTLEPGGYLLVWASGKDRVLVDDATEIRGGGNDIWSTADSFHLEHRQATGDLTLTMRLRSLADTNQWAKAGLMLRESLDAGSRTVLLRQTPDHGIALQWRSTSGGLTRVGDSRSGLASPDLWLRLQRSGELFIGLTSSDGATWNEVGRISITGLPSTLLAGIAVCSHDPGELTTAVLSDLSLTPAAAISSGWRGSDIGTGDPGSSRPAQVLHTDFKLSRDGEILTLLDSAGSVVDTVVFPALAADDSYARTPDGGTWRYHDQPTPGSANGSSTADGRVAAPTLSAAAGHYRDGLSLQLSCSTTAATIRYTLDGAEPSATSTAYTAPMQIDTTTVVRARAFAADLFPSAVVTATYLVDEGAELPVLSLAADPASFWGPEGIYDHAGEHGREWERAASLELIPAAAGSGGSGGLSGFAVDCGVRIHGGASRELSPKKSFRLYFRSDYGTRRLEHRLLGDTAATRFDTLVLRGGFNDCWAYFQDTAFDTQRRDVTYVRDQVTRDLHLAMGHPAAHGRFVELFLNGEYWGLYNLSERIEAEMLGSYDHDNDGERSDDWDVLSLEQEVQDGDTGDWHDLLARLPSLSHGELGERLDVDGFIDYVLLNLWLQAYDWPEHNGYSAAPRNRSTTRWIFLLWDTEISFGTGHDPDGWRDDLDLLGPLSGSPSPVGRLLAALLADSDLRQRFIRRFDLLMAGPLAPEQVLAALELRHDEVAAAIPREAERWGMARDGMPARGYRDWLSASERSRSFVGSRTTRVRQHLAWFFPEVTGWTTLTVTQPQGGVGEVVVAGIRPGTYPWSATFFTGVPLRLQAEPAPGFAFIGWTDPELPATATVELSLPAGDGTTQGYSVTAVFSPEAGDEAVIIVPVVAGTDGAQGSSWSSDIWIYNAGNTRAELELHPALNGQDNDLQAGSGLALDVSAGQTLSMTDVVRTSLAATGSGALFLAIREGSPTAIVVESNVMNRLDTHRSLGQQLAGVPLAKVPPTRTRLWLPGNPDPDRYRANLGLVSWDATRVQVLIHDSGGARLATKTITMAPRSHRQLNAVLSGIDPTLVGSGFVTVQGLDGRVLAYLSIVDRLTNDGSALLAQDPSNAAADCWLPGAALTAGASGSSWRTDLLVVNPHEHVTGPAIAFVPAGEPWQQHLLGHLTVPPLSMLVSENVLATELGLQEGLGALRLSEVEVNRVLVWARTYNATTAGTYGQLVAPRGFSEMIGRNTLGVLAGVSHDAGSRANLLLVNAVLAADGITLVEAEAGVALYHADGSPAGSTRYLLAPGELRQVNRFVEQIAGSGTTLQDGSVLVTLVSPATTGTSGGLDARISVVNGNQLPGTNDGRLITAQRVPLSTRSLW